MAAIRGGAGVIVAREVYCPHCGKSVPKSTYYRHRSKFYDPVSRDWPASSQQQTASDSDSSDIDYLHFSDEETMDYGGTEHEVTLSSTLQETPTSMTSEDDYDEAVSSEDELDLEGEEEIWSDEDDDAEASESSKPLPSVLRLFVVFLLSWQFLFRISDCAMSVLLLFFWHFIRLCSSLEAKFWDMMPKSYDGLTNLIDVGSNQDITLFVICPTCDSVYDFQSCFETKNNRKVSKNCKFVAFPNHPHMSRRKPCNALLLKEVTSGIKSDLVPRKSYPYHSLKVAITTLVQRPDFLCLCEAWRRRSKDILQGTLADIYDGMVWKDFNSDKYRNYLQFRGNLILSLNIDWFQPFTHTQYSVGALYLVVLNLPRQERYKIENIILIGIIPGPKEPKLTVNSYIAPLVQELNDAYKGWTIPLKLGGVSSVHIRGCIGCITCDIPASRKICGFLGHAARLGCNKCLKEFPTGSFGDKPNYGGYDRELWEVRTPESHKEKCMNLLTAKSQSALQSMESACGARYSVLQELPYFDAIRFTVIDPMHNLLLGTAKHVFSLWVKRGLLSTTEFALIQEKSEKISFPSHVGRIPLKIGSGFAGFTADQWRLWTTVLSPIVLKGILPDQDLRCWLLFVRACSLLCCRIITGANIDLADQYLLMFCKTYQALYGDEACTPNMHLHTHIASCLHDYGPVYSFWCFPFERFNGLLGAYHTNKKSIEKQIMRKFLREQAVKVMPFPDNTKEYQDMLAKHGSKGSVKETEKAADTLAIMKLATSNQFNSTSYIVSEEMSDVKTIPPTYNKVLSSCDTIYLQTIYQQLYPQKPITFMSRFYYRCKRIVLGDEVIASANKQAVIMAYWPSAGSSLSNIDYSKCCVGIVQYFLRHKVSFSPDKKTVEHIFCYVYWKQNHPSYNWFGQSAVITSTDFETENACCFMPVQRIAYLCAHGDMVVDFSSHSETVFVASPIGIRYSI